MFMSLMDSTIVNVAIPQMQRAFSADIHAVQWVIMALLAMCFVPRRKTNQKVQAEVTAQLA
jgi:MFS family permease